MLLLPSLPLDPRVIVGLFSGYPHIGLPHQEIRNKVLHLIRDRAPHRRGKVKASVQYVMQNLVVVLTAEGRPTAKHDVKHHAHRPIVALSRVASLEHLRRYIVWCPVRGRHQLVLRDLLSKAEVYQLYVRVVVFFV